MPNSNITIIKKLQKAINLKGYKILYNTQQFYSNAQDRPITQYIIKQNIGLSETNRSKYRILFKSTSMIQIVLYLRDYWFLINGWELPKDNEAWNKVRETLSFDLVREEL